MELLQSPFGEFHLSRYPVREKENLRAWDAADEYLLSHIAENQLINPDGRVLLVNDQCGALAVALNEFQVVSQSDSWLAQQGTLANFQQNNLEATNLTLIDSLDLPDTTFDLIVIKVPKSLAMLEFQLSQVRPLLRPGGRIIAGGMVKAIHTSTLQLFERLIGTTKTTLAVKKARLILPRVDSGIEVDGNKYPTTYQLENTTYEITNHAGVFSRDSLDIGTRFLLEHLPEKEGAERIIDLGCGNGIVGLMLAEKYPQAEMIFTDESYMAVDSARINFSNAFPGRSATFDVTDCLDGVERESVDLIVNNPPFHQQNAVGDFVARQMFRESAAALKNGGELWVIGNRHLGYHVQLKKVFGNCQTVASNRKFVILRARKGHQERRSRIHRRR